MTNRPGSSYKKYNQMGKLILETQVSIDGFIADKKGDTDWMVWNWGPDWTWDDGLQIYHTTLNTSAEAFIISSQMAQQGFNKHWGEVAEDATDRRHEFAKHITNSRKYVVSAKLTKDVLIPGGWSNTDIVTGELSKAISSLKSSIDGNLLVYGGATLISNLIDADLIDEYHLITNPVALGIGLPIFKNIKHLRLMNVTPFLGGVCFTLHQKLV
jgi:dihydrofolate reductase